MTIEDVPVIASTCRPGAGPALGTPPIILAADDDAAVLRFVKMSLERSGMHVRTVRSGAEALAVLEDEPVDLVVLDVTMPGMDGFETLRRIRASSAVPVIMLTGRARELDKLNALTNGADDYVVKPFNPDELAARISAILRRTQSRGDHGQCHGDVTIDLDRRRVTRGGEEVHLSRTEWSLLYELVTSPGKVLLHQELLTRVWGAEYRDETRYLPTWVSRLRAKLGDAVHITTFPGVGYRLEPPAPATDAPIPTASPADQAGAAY